MKDRAIRRHNRAKAVKKAFHIWWNGWGWEHDDSGITSRALRFPDRAEYYQYEYLEDKEQVWNKQNEAREEAVRWAKYSADNLKSCNCKRYQGETPFPKAKEQEVLNDDVRDLAEALKGEEILPTEQETPIKDQEYNIS